MFVNTFLRSRQWLWWGDDSDFNSPIPEPPKKPAALRTLLQFLMLPWALRGGIPPCPSLDPWLLPLHPFCHLQSVLSKSCLHHLQEGRPSETKLTGQMGYHPVLPFPGPQWQGTEADVLRDSDSECVFSEQIAHAQCMFTPLQRGHKLPDRLEGRKKHKEKQLSQASAAERKKLPFSKVSKDF